MRHVLACLILAATASPALAQTADKSGYDLFDPTPRDLLRDLSTDRPDKTESPYTVDAGHFQFELDFATFTSDREDGVRVKTVNFAPINLKLGLTNRTDLQIVVENYIRQTTTDRTSESRSKVDGFGDVTVRVKHNLWGNDGGTTALALMPFVKLPTNGNRLGNNAVEFGLIVPLAIGLSERFGLGLMTQVDFVEQIDGSGLAPSFVNTATVSFDLTDRIGLYTEIFTEKSVERGTDLVATLDAGVTFAVSPDIQLDAGANLGITDAADDVNLFVGLSRRF